MLWKLQITYAGLHAREVKNQNKLYTVDITTAA